MGVPAIKKGKSERDQNDKATKVKKLKKPATIWTTLEREGCGELHCVTCAKHILRPR